MSQRDYLFQVGDKEKIWQKYCGFFDLSVSEFMEIQRQLLLEQIELINDSPLSKKIIGDKKPTSIEEFRQLVPFTTYEDYAPYFNEKREDILAVKPSYWVRTSGRSGSPKWIPYTEDSDRVLVDGVITLLIIAGARRKGDVTFQEGTKILLNLPPRPYLSGQAAHSLGKRVNWQSFPPLEEAEKMGFQQKIQEGFRLSLKANLDYIGSLSSILVNIGERLVEGTGSLKFSWSLLHPRILYRLARGYILSKIERRPLLPKDLWPARNVLCGGIDSVIYKDLIKYYWGADNPAEMYLSTEAGHVAIQDWTKNGMTFYPYFNFLEFVPEEEWLKSREDPDYQPYTVLLDELEAGKRYELVITNLYGMPLLRYRIGDLIKIVSTQNNETGIKIPQMVFDSRSIDIIDVAGFTRIDEKEVWTAIHDTGIRYEDWTIRKEYKDSKAFLHLYIELKEQLDALEVKRRVHEHLKSIDDTYSELESLLELDPLEVTVLPRGTFQGYIEEKRKAGVVELSHLKPAHMGVADKVIEDIMRISGEVKSS